MRFTLTKEEKITLLQAATTGQLDTKNNSRREKEIRGQKAFLELMKSLPDIEDGKG